MPTLVGNVQELLHEARGLNDQVVALRRAIHREPEIGLELPLTQAKVLEALQGLPLDLRTGKRTTSVVATLRGAAPGPTILLRGDMDALPIQERSGVEFASRFDGRMHACGHDAHTAMLVGAARLLSRHRADLAGTIRFMFQPGEEGYHGAQVMLEEGVLDDPQVDAAFALHATPRYAAGTIHTRAGPVLASADTFTIHVSGRGGHASAPHLAADPIPVACEIVIALQTFVTRSVHAFEPGVVTVGKIEAGTAENVIPASASLTGTIRTVAPATRQLILDGIRRVARGIAEAHGVSADVHIDDGYPVTVNNADVAQLVLEVGRQLLGDDGVQEQPFPQMAAEDFSYVLERVPGAMVSLGTRPRGMREGEAPAGHSDRYLLEEEALPVGVAMHAAIALEYARRAEAPPARSG